LVFSPCLIGFRSGVAKIISQDIGQDSGKIIARAVDL